MCPRLHELFACWGEAKKSIEDSEDKEEKGNVSALQEEEQAHGNGY
jgi:hypothetical protein